MFDFGSGTWIPEDGVVGEIAPIPSEWSGRLVDPEVALILGPSGQPKSRLGNSLMSVVGFRDGDRLFVADTSQFPLAVGPLPLSDGQYFTASLQIRLVDLERLSADALASGLLTRDALGASIAGIIMSSPPDQAGLNVALRASLTSRGCELVSLRSVTTYDKESVPPFEGMDLEGGFVLESRLGEGAFGEVWLARQPRYGLLKAAKFVKDPEARSNLQREAKTVSALMQQVGGKHVAQLSFVSTEPFALMYEYVDGPDLFEYVTTKGGRLPEEEAIEITRQILETLDLAHTVKQVRGIGTTSLVHRDLHPGNVKLELRSGKPEVKLLDFGLAGSKRTKYEVSVARFGTDFIRPTHVCADPESDSAAPDPRDDLYSVGVLLFWMLTGEYRRPQARDMVDLIPDDQPGWRSVIEAACVGPRASRLAVAGQMREWLADAVKARPELELPAEVDSPRGVESARSDQATAISDSVQIPPVGPSHVETGSRHPRGDNGIVVGQRLDAISDSRVPARATQVTPQPSGQSGLDALPARGAIGVTGGDGLAALTDSEARPKTIHEIPQLLYRSNADALPAKGQSGLFSGHRLAATSSSMAPAKPILESPHFLARSEQTEIPRILGNVSWHSGQKLTTNQKWLMVSVGIATLAFVWIVLASSHGSG